MSLAASGRLTVSLMVLACVAGCNRPGAARSGTRPAASSKGARPGATRAPAAKPAAAAAGAAEAGAPDKPFVQATDSRAAGAYLVDIGGCNDCHTPGWLQTPGKIPETQRLIGTAVGFQGPWGVSYPANLRLLLQNMTPDNWIQLVRDTTVKPRPPMPWLALQQLSDPDLRAIYTYIKSLGPAGQPQPKDLPPGVKPKTPYIVFTPVGGKGG
jgi:hypothetical protein